jgi:arylsulfatase A-like enzyme
LSNNFRESNPRIKFWLFGLFFILLLLIEFANNTFSFIQNYSEGKVGSTFFSKIYECLSIIKYDLIYYIFSIIIIYLFFAWITYRFCYGLCYYFKKLDNIFFITGVNVYFILNLYVLNAFLYPASNHGLFIRSIFGVENFKFFIVISKILLFILFSGYFIVSFRERKSPKTIVSWVFIFIIFFSFYDPGYQFHRIMNFLKSNKFNNQGINVILIGVDSVSPSHVGYFGYKYNTTPNIDSFLKESVVFSSCYTPLARTFPSWYSILTGQYPLKNGARYNLIKRKFLKSEKWTISNILRNYYHYFTAHFTDETRFSNILYEDGFNYLKHPIMGVKDFIFATIHDFTITNVFFNSPLGYEIFPWLEDNRAAYHIYNPEFFTNDLISFIDVLKEKKRFFLAIHFCAPHWPYFTPAPFHYLFLDELNLFSMYDGAIRMADKQVGRLLNYLKKAGLYDKSIIVLLSDHGESFRGHGFQLRESSQHHMLLAIKPANSIRHKDINNLVRSIDIAPTILDLLKLDRKSIPFEGDSLLPLIKDEEDKWVDKYIIIETGFSFDAPGGIGLAFKELLEEGVVFYEFDKQGIITVKEEYHPVLIDRKQRGIQTEQWKLILEPLVRNDGSKNDMFKLSLYNIVNDPQCEENLVSQNLFTTRKLFRILKNYYRDEIKFTLYREEE